MGLGMRIVFPDFIGDRLPFVSELVALAAEGIDVLLDDQIGGFRAGLLDDLPEFIGILQHRARPQMVIVKGLSLAVFREERIL